MKKCTMCQTLKPETEFHKHRKNKSGLAERCKPCNRLAYKTSRDKNIEARRKSENARHRARRATPEFREKERIREAAARERKRKRQYARNVISRAITAGRLVRGTCEICGVANAEAHHDDYNKPTEIRWLCHVHHAEWHRRNGPGANLEGDPVFVERASRRSA